MGNIINFGDIATACSGASVEYGWAIGEAVMIPHLLASPLSLSPAIAGLIFLINPIFGFFVGPALGKVSDRTGQRRNWITILALTAILGHVILIISPSVQISRIAELTICFLAFGLMDLCHDLILIPGRALLVDRFSLRGWDVIGTEDGGVADAMYTTMQITGRLGGVFVATFPIESWFPYEASHYQAMLATSAIVLLITNSLAVTFSEDKILKITVQSDSQYNHYELQPLLNSSASDKKSCSRTALYCWSSESCVLGMVLIVQVIGWIGSLAFTFWYTTWLGLQTSFAGTSLSFPMVMMTLQTLLALAFSFFLPRLNKHFPIAWVWMLFELIFLGSLCSSRWLGLENPIATFVVLSIGGGPSYIVHMTNVQLLSRMVTSDENNIGWVAGLLNNTMGVAQILVGVLSGVFVVCNQPLDGSIVPCPQIGEVLYFWIGLLGLLIDLLILAFDICYFDGQIFSIQAEKKRRKSVRQSLSRMSLSQSSLYV